ncbi:phosphatidylinositol N-acetylglucosaminyltransferase-domain-containing protein [Xylariales sp. AK1849]|nr:phosphatidylinositol N-acetylglucosaminyltransferase-domain-containing protein [Xylariales sp. AK1849]
MASYLGPQQSTASFSSATDASFPPLTRAATLPDISSPRSGRSHLAPEDAFFAASPPRLANGYDNTIPHESGAEPRARRLRSKLGSRSRSRHRRRRRSWKKILWVKQSFPDNYTDQTTFLDSLQRNPRLQPYDFWPLVADTTVIVQQVCSVTIFICCFVGIFTERVSPVAVVGWGSFATFLGWLLWDWWVGQEEEDEGLQRQNSHRSRGAQRARQENGRNSTAATTPSAASSVMNLSSTERRHSQPNLMAVRQHHGGSATSLQSSTSHNSHSGRFNDPQDGLKHRPSSPLRGGRASLRLSTIKSAVLIYFTILGLSPILKSLTRSTSPDSIWAMSFWLLTINIFFYDYSGGVAVKFPASLSTNAALMASTVLASRLPSTGQVFSLTLFSIEVFGLFPVFRRYARHRSWQYHVGLSVLLVIGAGGGMGLILGDKKDGMFPWRSGMLGILVGVLIAVVAMGASSWWLIGLQKYKNAMNGPWDQARPIIISRRQWDDD